MGYFYFLSSMPLVLFDRKPPLSADFFLDSAKCSISHSDFNILSAAGLNPEKEYTGRNIFLREWTRRELSIRCYLAAARAAKAEFGYKAPSDIEPDSYAEIYSGFILDENNPRNAELLIDRGRWQFIDDYTKNDFFNLTSALAYYLKLLINIRNFEMIQERGEDGYNTILESYKIRFSSGIFSHA